MEAVLSLRINAFAPGVIDTPLIGEFRDEAIKWAVSSLPVCRMSTAEEVAVAVVFLMINGFITGEVFHIDMEGAGMCKAEEDSYPGLSQKVSQEIRESFPRDSWAEIASLLYERCSFRLPFLEQAPEAQERVQLAVLKLSNSDPQKVGYFIEYAETDWRDVLMWADRKVILASGRRIEDIRTVKAGGKGMAGKIMGVIASTIVALIAGTFGIAVFIGVGEAYNNAIAAFAAVSIPFALLAGFLSWLAPQARWPIAVAMAAPVTIICLMGAQMGSIYLPGAIWTIFSTVAGAYLGSRLKRKAPVAAS